MGQQGGRNIWGFPLFKGLEITLGFPAATSAVGLGDDIWCMCRMAINLQGCKKRLLPWWVIASLHPTSPDEIRMILWQCQGCKPNPKSYSSPKSLLSPGSQWVLSWGHDENLAHPHKRTWDTCQTIGTCLWNLSRPFPLKRWRNLPKVTQPGIGNRRMQI